MTADYKISIMTVCKNSSRTIEKSIKSVVEQNYKNIEYIIVDGASDDNTLEIINKYKNTIAKIISEKDSGIYNAMNKALDFATGDFLFFLNADDNLYSPKSIQNFVNNVSENIFKNNDIFYGDVIIKENEKIVNHWKSSPVSKFSIFRGSIPHPATFYKKGSFEKCGKFDESFKLAADYEWFMRALIKYNLKFYYFGEIISEFYKGGVSTKKNYAKLIKTEKQQARKKYYSDIERLYYNFRWRLKKIFNI
ncbi:MAG: glycosyltransferase [Ignavibacteriae bacterium]|nr:glycosyltransferase [Ignavibacteriota bacterium]